MSYSPARLSGSIALLGFLAAAPGGCGGVTAAPTDGGSTLTAMEGCMQVASALCGTLDTCAPVAIKVFYGDKSTCVARALLSCTTDQGAAGIGRTPSDLVSCATALGQATCSDLVAGTFPGVCTAKPGTIANGMPCGSDLQCVSTYCNKTGACGVCSPRAVANADCTVDVGCTSGLVCANKKCVPPAGPGGDCNLPNQPCRSNLYCTAKSGSGKCAAKLGPGGACADNDQACDLVKGAVCNPFNNHVCETVTVAKGGEACGLAAKTLCVGFIDPCSNFYLGSGICANPAEDGAACGGTAVCIPPAKCENAICRLPTTPDCH